MIHSPYEFPKVYSEGFAVGMKEEVHIGVDATAIES